MLMKENPGEGRIPALSPTWPGNHCGLNWPREGVAHAKTNNVSTKLAVLILEGIVCSIPKQVLKKPPMLQVLSKLPGGGRSGPLGRSTAGGAAIQQSRRL